VLGLLDVLLDRQVVYLAKTAAGLFVESGTMLPGKPDEFYQRTLMAFNRLGQTTDEVWVIVAGI
jgi:hypothetical protein